MVYYNFKMTPLPVKEHELFFVISSSQACADLHGVMMCLAEPVEERPVMVTMVM